jgi:hypothetical protein
MKHFNFSSDVGLCYVIVFVTNNSVPLSRLMALLKTTLPGIFTQGQTEPSCSSSSSDPDPTPRLSKKDNFQRFFAATKNVDPVPVRSVC